MYSNRIKPKATHFCFQKKESIEIQKMKYLERRSDQNGAAFGFTESKMNEFLVRKSRDLQYMRLDLLASGIIVGAGD